MYLANPEMCLPGNCDMIKNRQAATCYFHTKDSADKQKKILLSLVLVYICILIG